MKKSGTKVSSKNGNEDPWKKEKDNPWKNMSQEKENKKSQSKDSTQVVIEEKIEPETRYCKEAQFEEDEPENHETDNEGDLETDSPDLSEKKRKLIPFLFPFALLILGTFAFMLVYGTYMLFTAGDAVDYVVAGFSILIGGIFASAILENYWKIFSADSQKKKEGQEIVYYMGLSGIAGLLIAVGLVFVPEMVEQVMNDRGVSMTRTEIMYRAGGGIAVVVLLIGIVRSIFK